MVVLCLRVLRDLSLLLISGFQEVLSFLETARIWHTGMGIPQRLVIPAAAYSSGRVTNGN
jgi:hypothetical protein